jgi:hypothetical protein
MKTKLPQVITIIFMLLLAQLGYSANPSLGTAADFVIFSTNGGISNVSHTLLTGKVGTNNGSIGGFGNVNGGMHNADGVTAAAAGDLLIAFNLLSATVSQFFPAPLLGNGQTLTPGVHEIAETASLSNKLYLDGQNNANAEFVIKIGGAFSTAALSEIVLLNGAKACNVFWTVEGMVVMASGTIMKGNMIANNGAIVMNAGVQLEGRALTTAGAISSDGITAFTPIGCGSAVLSGPQAPDLKSTSCYALLSAAGAMTNAGISFIKGDVGTNVGVTSGFQELNVVGEIHPLPDASTAAAAADMIDLHAYLNNLTHDIELLYPALLGQNLELTPNTYWLNAATVLTDTLYLNALGNADAVFVIKITGALTTSTFAKVLLSNGAQAKNVYWKVTGAVDINENSEFKGVIVAQNGAINIKTGVELLGRVFSTSGAITTNASTITMQTPCVNSTTNVLNTSNPKEAIIFANAQKIDIELLGNNTKALLYVYNSTGSLVHSSAINQANTSIAINLSSGIYFYKLSLNNNKQTGKFIVSE